MNEELAWYIIADVLSSHILTEKKFANIRKYAEIRLTGIKYKELRKCRKPKKMRKAK